MLYTKKYELDLGLALGLFAIFGIIRYRTDPLKVREMTYLFVVIGVSIINALSNKKMSYLEILLANSFISISIYYLDRYWSQQRLTPQKKTIPKDYGIKDVIYNSLENIKPEQFDLLKNELENSLGVEILKLDINEVDFEKQTAKKKSDTKNSMKKISKRLLHAVICITFSSSLIYGQNNSDLEGWSAVELDLKASKKLSFSISEHLRYRNDISSMKNYFTQVKVNYSLFKKFSLGGGVRYITKNDDVGNIQGNKLLLDINLMHHLIKK